MANHKRSGQEVIGEKGKPTMADVLSKMGSVQLKKVARSPGGTLIRHEASGEDAEMSGPQDPAAMIAAALKRKFANRKPTADSPSAWEDKENEIAARRAKAAEKNVPAFGAHMLRKAKRAPMGDRQTAKA